MADFVKAEVKTGRNEGGFSDDSADAGGETYRGIASAFHPSWQGWAAVRAASAKARGGLQRTPREDWAQVDAALAGNLVLQGQVSNFYKIEFWDRLGLDGFQVQLLAEVLYDAAVNCGVGKAALWLQQGLNALNEGGTLYPDLLEDGGVGPKTLATAVDFQKQWTDRSLHLTAAVLILRGAHHLARMRERPDQERFARSWLGRVARQMGELC